MFCKVGEHWTAHLIKFSIVCIKSYGDKTRNFLKEYLKERDGMRKLEIHMQMNEPKLYLIPLMEINWKWINDSNVRPDTIKFLEENIWEKLFDFGLNSDFLYMTFKPRKQK